MASEEALVVAIARADGATGACVASLEPRVEATGRRLCGLIHASIDHLFHEVDAERAE